MISAVRFLNDLEDVVRLFFPTYRRDDDAFSHKITVCEREEGNVLFVRATVDETVRIAETRLPEDASELIRKRLAKRFLKTVLYDALSERTGIAFPWGSLTGIRPTRIGRELIEEGALDPAEALREQFRVSPRNARLVAQILANQEGYRSTGERDASFYLHIPICPSRCYYCSFVSELVSRCADLDEYVAALARDAAETARMLDEFGYRVTSVYVGGGTPTVLNAAALRTVLNAVPYRGVEFTVEAGRPDTIDEEKLAVMRDAGVTRVSVNPQTFCDGTLARIGRAHTSADTLRAFEAAKKFGFSVNADLIAGLEGETLEDFSHTVDETIRIAPENVTVHTLCMKRGSDVHVKGIDYRLSEPLAQAMTELADDVLSAAGYVPYYLYRQKNALFGLPNVGYARPGYQCGNNIDTMEEFTTVAACGSGAISKRLCPGGRIERFAEVKPIRGYLDRFDEMLAKKRALLAIESVE